MDHYRLGNYIRNTIISLWKRQLIMVTLYDTRFLFVRSHKESDTTNISCAKSWVDQQWGLKVLTCRPSAFIITLPAANGQSIR
jgi:hypothetical protein